MAEFSVEHAKNTLLFERKSKWWNNLDAGNSQSSSHPGKRSKADRDKDTQSSAGGATGIWEDERLHA